MSRRRHNKSSAVRSPQARALPRTNSTWCGPLAALLHAAYRPPPARFLLPRSIASTNNRAAIERRHLVFTAKIRFQLMSNLGLLGSSPLADGGGISPRPSRAAGHDARDLRPCEATGGRAALPVGDDAEPQPYSCRDSTSQQQCLQLQCNCTLAGRSRRGNSVGNASAAAPRNARGLRSTTNAEAFQIFWRRMRFAIARV
jgi:hypothetical protein